MTKEIAINVLNQIKELILNDKSWLESTHEPISQCFDMAIKSLEAWEKVEADILGLDGCYDDAFWDGVNLVSDIIDKHLSEVSE